MASHRATTSILRLDALQHFTLHPERIPRHTTLPLHHFPNPLPHLLHRGFISFPPPHEHKDHGALLNIWARSVQPHLLARPRCAPAHGEITLEAPPRPDGAHSRMALDQVVAQPVERAADSFFVDLGKTGREESTRD